MLVLVMGNSVFPYMMIKSNTKKVKRPDRNILERLMSIILLFNYVPIVLLSIISEALKKINIPLFMN